MIGRLCFLYIDAPGFPVLKAVDLTSGLLSVLSDVATGSGPAFTAPKGIVVDSENHRAMMVDSVLNALLVIDLTTGYRAITSQ